MKSCKRKYNFFIDLSKSYRTNKKKYIVSKKKKFSSSKNFSNCILYIKINYKLIMSYFYRYLIILISTLKIYFQSCQIATFFFFFLFKNKLILYRIII